MSDLHEIVNDMKEKSECAARRRVERNAMGESLVEKEAWLMMGSKPVFFKNRR